MAQRKAKTDTSTSSGVVSNAIEESRRMWNAYQDSLLTEKQRVARAKEREAAEEAARGNQ